MRVILILLFICAAIGADAQEYVWKFKSMDGSRTGCQAITAENADQSVGYFLDGVYISPNGRRFSEGSTVCSVARIVMDAQPEMARVKQVVGHSSMEMPNAKSETMLSRWFVDLLMNKVASLSGKTVDVGICNFGGIRIGMPEGDVMLDDILSMFPFKNNLVYLEMKGSRLRTIFENMAARKFHAVGGVKITVEDKKLTSVLIGGEPLEDDKTYGVATISFLLDGGDSLTLSEGASGICIYDMYVADAVLEHLQALTAEGKSVTGNDIPCVTIK